MNNTALLMAVLSGMVFFFLGILFATRLYKNVKPRRMLEEQRHKLMKNLNIEAQVLSKIEDEVNTEEYNKQKRRVDTLFLQQRAISWALSEPDIELIHDPDRLPDAYQLVMK